MGMDESDRMRRLEAYAHDSQTTLGRKVGFGASGTVYETMRNSAIKAHDTQASYERERNAYLRLRRRGVREICGCRVPTLIDVHAAVHQIIAIPAGMGMFYYDAHPGNVRLR